MLRVEEAIMQVRAQARPLEPIAVPTAEALGLVLAESVRSDIDSPPYDKSLVDGYAVQAAGIIDGSAELTILEEVTAGNVPRFAVGPGQATRIMTGAPLPAGANAVVMIEQTESLPGASPLGLVRISGAPARENQNIMRRATSIERGQVVLPPGQRLRAIELGLLAEVGHNVCRVFPRPTMAVLSTGDELVPADQMPAAGQIRNSNGPMLMALATEVGVKAVDLGIARDTRDSLRQKISQGLECDMLVLSGGVSAGVLDLVPGVLAELGVRQVFHKVRVKPGKPIWFGVREQEGKRCLVFGLPGNPVSSLVCFDLFVRDALSQMGSWGDNRVWMAATLTGDFVHKGDRPTYHPVELWEDRGKAMINILNWRGSADLKTLAYADALACFPAGDSIYPKGEIVIARRL